MHILNVTDRLSELLRDQIISGELAPGSKLNEAQLAKKFGVSRAPVREALRVLEAKKLVTRLPRRGTHVARLTVAELEELFQARQMIESYAVCLLRMHAKRKFPKVQRALEKALSTPFPSLDNKSAMLDYIYCFSGFHVGLIEEAENMWLIDFYDTITYNLARYQFICLYIPGLAQDSLEMHRDILHKLEAGKYKVAEKLLLEHMTIATEAVIRKLNQTNDVQGL